MTAAVGGTAHGKPMAAAVESTDSVDAVAAPRVLFVNRDLDRAEVDLLLRLHRAGVFVRALSRAETPIRQPLQRAGIYIEAVPYRSKLSARFCSQIVRLVRRQRIDVIHAADSRSLANAVWASRFCRVHVVGYRGTISKIRRSDPSYWLGLLSPRVEKIFCVSRAVRDYLAGFVPPEKLVVNYKGFDPSWAPGGVPPELPAAVGGGAQVVMHIGNARGRPHKGLNYLVEAFHEVRSSTAHLVVFGTYSEADAARAVSGPAAARIHLLGEVDAASRYLPRADIYVQPSLLEGLPRALKEAMAAGVAAIVSDIPSLAEMIVDEESGLLVPPADPAALATAIERLLRDSELRVRLAVNARRRLVERFSQDAYFERTLAVYRQLVAARSTRDT